ncbi:unnamed protein product [Mytilus edulis]|uniref:CARD domain-containing protein n=1 Tax=Mytilus edulis TaxID=6550 RepID=A0A8S3SUN1_MYTED|nr:unnamed protein product [Mytilus edulis]
MMDEFERQSLYNCRHEFYDNVDSDKFVQKLHNHGVLSESQRQKIQRCKSNREKMANVLQTVSFGNQDCYQNIVSIMKEEYPMIANKMELELLKERTSNSRDVNESLIEIINEQLLPIVYGKGKSNEEDFSSKRPHSSVSRLSELIRQLQLRCLRILNVKPSEARNTALPVLINRKIKEQQEVVRQLKEEINEIKSPKKKNQSLHEELDEINLAEKIYQLRKELQDQHERVRLLQLSVHSKESTVLDLKTENAIIQNEIQELRKQRPLGKLQVNLLFDD